MTTNQDQNKYQVFLIRCWPNSAPQANHPSSWRFIVESVDGSQHRGFEDVETLLVFLQSEFPGKM